MGPFSKLLYLSMDNLANRKSSRSCTYIFFLPIGVENELIFVIYGQCFSRYRQILKITIFRYEKTLATGKSSRSYTYTLFLPQGVDIELIFALRASVSEIGPFFKIAIFGHESWPVAMREF